VAGLRVRFFPLNPAASVCTAPPPRALRAPCSTLGGGLFADRLVVGNLSYATTEADLRTYFGTVAPPAQVVVPVDRETGRPRGFAFIEYQDRAHAEQARQRFNGQPFNGRPLAVSEARAREDRGPGGPPRPGGYSSGPPPGGRGFGPRPPRSSR